MKRIILILIFTTSLFAQWEWSDPVMLSEKVTWPDANYGSTNIILDNEGNIHTFWVKTFDLFNNDYSQIMYRKSIDGGDNWSAIENLTPDYTDNDIHIGNLNVVCDSENKIHLMFLRGTEWSKVMHMKYNGTTWSTPISIYDFAINYLNVEIDVNDRIYSVWWSDPSYYSYLEEGIWSSPVSISNTYLPFINDFIIDSDNNIYASGLIDIGYYAPFLCKYDKVIEGWTDFEQIDGFYERSVACALTLSRDDTLNVNVSVGPTWDANINYNIKRKIGDANWTTPQYINGNTDMLNKDFFRDNDDNLHLFEQDMDSISLIYTTYNNNEWEESVIREVTNHRFGKQKVYFDETDNFYLIYYDIDDNTDEWAVFFQKKHIEVGIEDSDELLIMNYELEQNYPNPFNNQTSINYVLQNIGEVEINVFNSTGQFVQNLVNEKQGKGSYSISFNANNLNSGVYYYRLKINGIVHNTKKMLYLR